MVATPSTLPHVALPMPTDDASNSEPDELNVVCTMLVGEAGLPECESLGLYHFLVIDHPCR